MVFVEFANELGQGGYGKGIKGFEIGNGDTDASSFGVYTKGRFEQMVAHFGNVNIESGIGVPQDDTGGPGFESLPFRQGHGLAHFGRGGFFQEYLEMGPDFPPLFGGCVCACGPGCLQMGAYGSGGVGDGLEKGVAGRGRRQEAVPLRRQHVFHKPRLQNL